MRLSEILEEPLDLGLRRTSHWPRQPMCDLFLEYRVRGQPDDIGIICLFQSFVDRRDCVGGIRPKEVAAYVAVKLLASRKLTAACSVTSLTPAARLTCAGFQKDAP